jgi:hypothetical protein
MKYQREAKIYPPQNVAACLRILYIAGNRVSIIVYKAIAMLQKNAAVPIQVSINNRQLVWKTDIVLVTERNVVRRTERGRLQKILPLTQWLIVGDEPNPKRGPFGKLRQDFRSTVRRRAIANDHFIWQPNLFT